MPALILQYYSVKKRFWQPAAGFHTIINKLKKTICVDFTSTGQEPTSTPLEFESTWFEVISPIVKTSSFANLAERGNSIKLDSVSFRCIFSLSLLRDI